MLANNRRPWTEEDIAKLKIMAGRRKPKEIADKLGRSVGATVRVAAKLRIPLRTRFQFGRPDTVPDRLLR
jgi:hypothetical protein